jgi:putative transposase
MKNIKDREGKNRAISESLTATHERRKTQVLRVFKMKIHESDLSKRQKFILETLFLEAKRFKNHVLSWCEKDENNKPWNFDTRTKAVDVKYPDGHVESKPLEFLGSQYKSDIVQTMCANIRALATKKKNGRKIGRLKFKKEVKCLGLKKYGNTHYIKSSRRVKIANVPGFVPVNGLQQFINEPNIEIANGKLTRTPRGYFLALTVFFPKKNEKKEHKEEIGVDFGCMTSFTLSNGEKIDTKIQESDRLKWLQQRAAKKQKGSKNRVKAFSLVGREYQKLTNQKNDAANKVVAKLLEHEKVYIQDENLKGWQKGGHGRAIQHSILGRVKAKLVLNPRVVVLDRFVPTTKSCECGHVHDDLKLWDRTFVCPVCSLTEDRDVHAAKNMIRLGKMKENLKRVGRGLTELTPLETLASGETMDVVALSRCRRSGKVLGL